MPLHIYYSDKIEELAADLKGKLLDDRKGKEADPFSFSTVVVPNTNIAKWLRIRKFADTPSLCMGIEFPFIENALFGLLAECLPAKDRPKLLPMNAYSIGIMSILVKDGDTALEPFRKYISGDDKGPFSVNSREKARMAWQLSVMLADLMDKYEVHRPEIVRKWLEENRDAEGKPLVAGSVEAAEAALAKKLFGAGGLYPPDNSGGKGLSLRQLFDKVQNTVSKPPAPEKEKTIYFFGLSTLSSLQARILYWLAKTYNVVFYHNNVCMEYWGDIEKKEERIKRLGKAHPPEEDIEIENPLLSQWGVAGRETMRLLVDLEEEDGGQVGFTWTAVSAPDRKNPQRLLGKIQDSILHRTSDVKERSPQDASLQIVAAPGIRREVEMVYNAILGAVWPKDDDAPGRPWSRCKFSDIAVLVPDMATYRPVIESVFDGRGQIPYGLIDTTASEDSTYLRGFLDLMALAREGLSRETLFAVLDNPCVQRALSFGPGDVRSWRRFAKGTGAFDGFEVEEKKKEYRNFSWSEALRRLRLGVVADGEDNSGEDSLVVWDGGDDGSALKFSAIVETLYRELAPLASDTHECATKPEDRDSAKDDETTWYGKLRHVANEFLAVERDDKLEGPVKGQLFGTLSSLFDIEGSQGLDLVVAAVEQFVGGVKCQKGSYLTNGVTIAGL
ncbi:MAG: exodeoxyribonuclease V subunit gamma, partial [Kiritimatiellae bacterium]|nr:exodeoxyribonuclease V subunit gamma [Kiritimatiellia bacterium]